MGVVAVDHFGRCGWTANFEQLQFQICGAMIAPVAAGPRILNSYNDIGERWVRAAVAAGPRILNSYNARYALHRVVAVAAGPRILNSYNNHPKRCDQPRVAAGPRILNSYNKLPTRRSTRPLRLDREF